MFLLNTRSVLYTLLLLAVGCSPSTTPKGSTGPGYYEDLSAYRPKVEIPADTSEQSEDQKDETLSATSAKNVRPINRKLNTKLDSISSQSQAIRYVNGYTIQVYSGRNRESALIAKGKVSSILPDSRPYQEFKVPNFRVNVGRFYSKIEAQKTYSQLKNRFPSAIVVMKKFKIPER